MGTLIRRGIMASIAITGNVWPDPGRLDAIATGSITALPRRAG